MSQPKRGTVGHIRARKVLWIIGSDFAEAGPATRADVGGWGEAGKAPMIEEAKCNWDNSAMANPANNHQGCLEQQFGC